jgi:hypothetical protein
MRRPFALLALAAMAWSNATALPCVVSTIAPEPPVAAGAQHAHAGHAPSTPDGAQAPGHSHDGSRSHPGTSDCGVLMACGTALGTNAADAAHVLAAGLEPVAAAYVGAPSTADLTRDPPPPRRNA